MLAGIDRGLAVRIGATLCAVVVVDVLVVGYVAAALSPWLVPLAPGLGRTLGLGVPTWAAWLVALAVVVAAFLVLQARAVRRNVLAAVDADPITAESHPNLHARVTRLAAQAGLPPPSVAIAPTDVPNSVTVGGLRGATVVLSQGLLDALDDEALDAVVAHELAHVANRDAQVLTMAAFVPAVVSGRLPLLGRSPSTRRLRLGLVLVGLFLLPFAILQAPWGGSAAAGRFLLALFLATVLGGVVLGVLATPLVYLGQRLSRYREFAADRAAAQLVGDPHAVVSALTDLDPAVEPPDRPDLRDVFGSVDRLCFLPHSLPSTAVEVPEGDGWPAPGPLGARSHPGTEQRIDRLRELYDDFA